MVTETAQMEQETEIETKRPSAAWYALPFAFTLALIAAQLGGILALNDGRFMYAIDDPYIHLALSESLYTGHYGINATEHSAPASSILWPALLAPAAPFTWHEYLPLIIGVVATLGCVALWLALFKRMGLTAAPNGPILAAGLTCVAMLGLNFIGVLFTGMEHPVQFFLTLSVVLGLAIFLETGRIPWYLIPALLIGPLIRYENAAIAVAALIILVLRRRYAAAAITALIFAVIIGAFSFMLHSLGLSILPSSVLVHSEVAQSSVGETGAAETSGITAVLSRVKALLLNVKDVVYSAEGRLVAAIAAVLFVQWLLDIRHRLAFARLFGFLAITGTLLGGKFGGSFFRYETNILILAIALLLYCNADLVVAAARTFKPRYIVAFSAVLVLTLWCRYAYEMVQIPWGANNIYEQQYQLHRFATQYYRKPIGVNDLGWTSYRNKAYVLDLWGLASERARQMRMAKEPGWMDTLAKKHDVQFAMLFEPWFTEYLPAHWQKVAELHLGGPRVTTAQDTVAFYVIDPAIRPEVVQQLAAFQSTLPAGVRLDILPETSPGSSAEPPSSEPAPETQAETTAPEAETEHPAAEESEEQNVPTWETIDPDLKWDLNPDIKIIPVPEGPPEDWPTSTR